MESVFSMKSAAEVSRLISHHASRGCPFLFGVDFELREGFFIENPLAEHSVLWRVGAYTNCPSREVPPERSFGFSAVTVQTYAQKFAVVKAGLMRGDSFLANLTLKTPVHTDYSLAEIFDRSDSKYALMIPGRLVCFSPETFVKISEGKIYSFPMKGTIRGEVPNARAVILADAKEQAEHYTIVDLIRNDLGRVATDVEVEQLRYIDSLSTTNGEILQVSSRISGRLPDNYAPGLGELLFELLPAGSVSGAPKPATLRLLERAEGEPRGFYCGVFGYFDGKELDSAVMIRFIEQNDRGELFFRSGGGITVNSDMESEYREVLDKIYLPRK